MPVSRRLGILILPDKIRHREVTEVEVTVTVILGNDIDVLHKRIQHARRDNNATFVVEEDVVRPIAIVWACDLAHRVQRPIACSAKQSSCMGDVLPAIAKYVLSNSYQ